MTTTTPTPTTTSDRPRSARDELAALGWEINANQYRAVHLAARYDEEKDWFRAGLKSAAAGISSDLQIQASTAREWIRVGRSLRYLPLIDAAFAANSISYAKTRILTRWADDDNEQQLLHLAQDRTAGRLTAAIARLVAADESDEDRDRRHHWDRSFTSWTDGDGMTVIRIVLPPSLAKPVLASVDDLVRQIAQTPAEPWTSTHADSVDAPAGASELQSVTTGPVSTTLGESDASAGASAKSLAQTLRDLRQRWQPGADDDWDFPMLNQQRADAFAALFLGLNVAVSTEVVVHVRGDGNTFDDGTPITTNAITRQLDDSFIRLMIHDSQRRPIDATNRRRHPTTRQARLSMEAHNHECIDCQSIDLIELDHNPPYEQTRHTVTTELEPRCVQCHRARHRYAA